MNRKRYFNGIKKEICLHQLFSKPLNYFSTKSPRTSIRFCQRCTSFSNLSLKKLVFCFWNHFLPADFTSSSQLKRWPFKCSFRFGNRWKSLGANLGYTVDVAALKIQALNCISCCCTCVRPGVVVLKKCFISYSSLFDSSFLMQWEFQCNIESLLLFLFQ